MQLRKGLKYYRKKLVTNDTAGHDSGMCLTRDGAPKHGHVIQENCGFTSYIVQLKMLTTI